MRGTTEEKWSAFSSENPQKHISDAHLYFFHEISLYFGELPKRSWHIIFASQGWLFTKGLTVEPEGCTRKCFKKQVFVGQR